MRRGREGGNGCADRLNGSWSRGPGLGDRRCRGRRPCRRRRLRLVWSDRGSGPNWCDGRLGLDRGNRRDGARRMLWRRRSGGLNRSDRACGRNRGFGIGAGGRGDGPRRRSGHFCSRGSRGSEGSRRRRRSFRLVGSNRENQAIAILTKRTADVLGNLDTLLIRPASQHGGIDLNQDFIQREGNLDLVAIAAG